MSSADPRDRILTIPNALSFARLLLVPVFLWLILGPQQDELALVVLVVSGATDWLDGKIARATGATSRLGELLDPAADRLFIIATVIGLLVRGIVPLWLVILLMSRDLLLLVLVPALKKRGITALPVHFLGKAATMNLLYAFPLLLLSDGTGLVATAAYVIGWAFVLWGCALYWCAGLLYVTQARAILST